MSSTKPIDTLGTMRTALRDMGLPFQEGDGTLFSRIAIENLEVHLICWGDPDDLARIVVRLPLRAAKASRAAVGEFLHRLNFKQRRKLWEMNCDNGEIRLACFINTIAAPLIGSHFCALVESLLTTADAVFPCLASVLTERMTPEFAADQAKAATNGEGNLGEQQDGNHRAET